MISSSNLGWILVVLAPPVLAAVVCIGLWKWAKRDEAAEARQRAEQPELYKRPD